MEPKDPSLHRGYNHLEENAEWDAYLDMHLVNVVPITRKIVSESELSNFFNHKKQIEMATDALHYISLKNGYKEAPTEAQITERIQHYLQEYRDGYYNS